MNFPEKYIKRGNFKLHSGASSKVLFDVNELLTNYREWIKIREAIPKHYDTYVGVATGGAIIASHFNTYKEWGMVKDGEYKGPDIKHDYCLIDDVCTTETSLREAMKILHAKFGKYPEEIFVVVDRRKEQGSKRTLHIESLYEIEPEVEK